MAGDKGESKGWRGRFGRRKDAPSGPVVRVKTANGQVWDEPSEDLLFELFSDMERGDEEFFILDRLTDPTGQTYAQTRLDGPTYTVEHRTGSPDRHYRALTDDKQLAHQVLTGWTFDLDGWQDLVTWERDDTM